QGRYAYGNQPYIGGWNLARFAETLLPLLHEDEEQAVELAQEEMESFTKLYHSNWLAGMRAKLGLFNEETEDEALVKDLLSIMQNHRADYTNTFRALTLGTLEDTALFGTSEFNEWSERWQARLGRQQEPKDSSNQLMRNSNPVVIPRNHRVEEALEAAVEQGEYSVMEKLLTALSNPYEYSLEQTDYTTPPEPSNRPYRTFCGT
ncbi:MAG TPA: protein adenylyltransferase SelO family protein, partial [Pseudobacillus sp.]